jgi:HSP90 family molecular chaperone
VRELTSNAADACEKLRYYQLTRPEDLDTVSNPLQINISVDKEKRLFVIQVF